jgi:signal transduction protein with GAF and PtsI domain
MSNGAIVAPMFAPESCIGVLAAEVRHGRESDGATQSVTLMLAAQLATVVGSASNAQASMPRAQASMPTA